MNRSLRMYMIPYKVKYDSIKYKIRTVLLVRVSGFLWSALCVFVGCCRRPENIFSSSSPANKAKILIQCPFDGVDCCLPANKNKKKLQKRVPNKVRENSWGTAAPDSGASPQPGFSFQTYTAQQQQAADHHRPPQRHHPDRARSRRGAGGLGARPPPLPVLCCGGGLSSLGTKACSSSYS